MINLCFLPTGKILHIGEFLFQQVSLNTCAAVCYREDKDTLLLEQKVRSLPWPLFPAKACFMVPEATLHENFLLHR